jgi:hypothetical protein
MPTPNGTDRVIGQLSAASELIRTHGDICFLEGLQDLDKGARHFAEEGPSGVIAAIMFNFGIGLQEIQQVSTTLGIPVPTSQTTLREFLGPVMAAA